MKPIDRHPQFIAIGVAATGALFLCACFINLPFLTAEPPGAYVLMGLSIVLLVAGCYFFWRARQGKLEPQGKTVAEVRIQAIEKMHSTELLSRIALEDDNEMVRKKAARRLEEITA
jgi:hypothetical protein